MDVANCLPKDKSDYDSIKLLKALPKPELKLILPDLLEWTQDINWPVAPLIIDELLIPLGQDLIPSLKNILVSKEYDWIQNILWHLIRKLDIGIISSLKEELYMLTQSKNKDFIEYDIPEIAEGLLAQIK